jgi:hypothetical protein
MGIENATIRFVIDTTNSRICGMSGAAVPADSRQISAIRRPDLPLGARHPVQAPLTLVRVPWVPTERAACLLAWRFPIVAPQTGPLDGNS